MRAKMTKSTVYLLVGTAITFGLLFLFVSVRLAGIGAAVFMAGYSSRTTTISTSI